MKHVGIGLLAAIVGFICVASIGYFLISKLSSTQDKSVEASMTSIFVLGPLGAIVFFIIGYMWSKSHW